MAVMEGNIFRKIFIMIWKNVLLRKRHYIQTALEIILPTLLFVILVAIHSTGDKQNSQGETTNVVEANIPKATIYPIEYCASLTDMMESAAKSKNRRKGQRTSGKDDDDPLEFTLLARELYFTNVPGDANVTTVKESRLVWDIMDTVQKTVNNFLVPCCTLVNQIENSTISLKLTENSLLKFNQSASNDLNENDIEKLSKIAQLGQFNDISNGNTSTILYGGVIFPEDFDYDDEASTTCTSPKCTNMSYTLRFTYKYVQYETDSLYSQGAGPSDSGKKYQHFVKLQNLIDYAYIQLTTDTPVWPLFNTNENPEPDFDHPEEQCLKRFGSLTETEEIWVPGTQEMPYPEYKQEDIAFFISFISMFMILSFAIIIPPLIKRIVHEKESGIKELLKIMGLPNWVNWLTWFLDAFIATFITIALVILLICVEWSSGYGKIIQDSDPFLMFIFFMLYGVSLISFCFALSTLFTSPNLALTAGIVLHLLTYFLAQIIIQNKQYPTMAVGKKIGLALLPNACIQQALVVLQTLEGTGGLRWGNLFDRIEPDDPMTMGVYWIMFLADAVIYALIMWYIDTIKPGSFGVGKKWYFPFECCIPTRVGIDEEEVERNASAKRKVNENLFEEYPSGQPVMEVKNLRKVFRSLTGEDLVAVNDVSFRAFGGQIMALLGHNGAGKSTTFNILTGMYSKTAGDSMINGYDTDKDLDTVRKSLGICPQHNMLFPELTVNEHFTMFGMIKGLSKKEATKQATEYITRLNLEPKRNIITDKLSGGMKRKVNLGIALVGDSTVVLLDEPTSGMDPQARRYTWDLLQTEKKKRTILLTTHFMEEADILGDRIAIMARGQIQCYGTSMFLKNKLGEGYSLTMTLGGNCNVEKTESLVKECIQTAEVKSNASGELIFALPAADSKSFGALFESLEKKKLELDIGNFGLSITTMEDVFLRVGYLAEERHNIQRQQSQRELQRRKSMKQLGRGNSKEVETQKFDEINGTSTNHPVDSQSDGAEKLKGFQLFKSRILGLLWKRIICTWRRWILFLLIALIPMFMALSSQLIIHLYSNFEANFEARTLQLSDYDNPMTTMPNEVESNTSLKDVYDEYEKLSESESVKKYANISTGLLTMGTDHLADYRKDYVIGGNFERDPDFTIPIIQPSITVDINYLTGLYNPIPKHSKPLSVNLMSNALLRHLDNTDSNPRTILTTNHPLPFTFTAPSDLVSDGFISPYIFTYGSLLSIAMSLLVSLFLIFPLVERTSGAKHLQMMTGLHPATFWMTNLAWDFLIYLISSSLMIAFLMAFDYDHTFTSFQGPGATILVTLFHGIPAILMAYLFSFWANTPASGFSVMTILGVISGLLATTAVWICLGFESFDSDVATAIGYVVKYLFMFIPTFNFGRAIMAIAQIQLENNVCSSGIDTDTVKQFCRMFDANPISIMNNVQSSAYLTCCTEDFMAPEPQVCGKKITDFPGFDNDTLTPDQQEQINNSLKCLEIKNLFSWDEMKGINFDLVFFVMNTVLFGILLVMIEKKVFRSLLNICKSLKSSDSPAGNDELDGDVETERRRVLNNNTNPQNDDLLTVTNLQKDFGKFKAVQGISFGVHYGECFGFLGINGAGKTTSFKMLTGDEQLTAGEATLRGYRLANEPERFLSEIGYCPQFDAIIDQMTGREMLVLFCRLRGITPQNVENECEKWISFLGLDEYADRQCGTYSGGNKRKLSIGMALVGDPPIIFFDEPSTGVDPVARRKLWNVISKIQQRGQSVVLTSHSMEECEALCDRLAIMVNGQFQCFGNIPHLKNKFGQGFTVLVKLEKGAGENLSELNEVRDALLTRLSNAVIQDEHKEFIHVHVRDVNMLWSSMFRIMEDIRDEFHGVEDYSISETSLEQVFISFAKNQQSTDQTRRKSIKKMKSRTDDEPDEDEPQHQIRKLQRHLSTVSRVSEKYETDNETGTRM